LEVVQNPLIYNAIKSNKLEFPEKIQKKISETNNEYVICNMKECGCILEKSRSIKCSQGHVVFILFYFIIIFVLLLFYFVYSFSFVKDVS
jgi:hypothetical protein